ncbi:MAG: amidohydrolase [Candidatus Limnocylindrales bacterium]
MSGPAELVLLGRTITLAGDHGLAVVAGIAIRAGRISAAGTRAEIEATCGPRTRRIELAPDEVALPGLTDSHLHLADAAIAGDELDLSAAPTLEAGLAAVETAHRRLPPGAWLTGHGWARDQWGAWPTANDLASRAPDRRVALWAHDHHALWVSPTALTQALVGPATPDPPGGAIRRDEQGVPTGILHESASALVNTLVPAPSAADYVAALPALCRDLVALGVVAVHDPGLLRGGAGLGGPLLAYGHLADAGDLPLRVFASIRSDALDGAIAQGIRSGAILGGGSTGRARFGWLKLFADGSLGSRTAAMLEPFEPLSGGPGASRDAGGDRERGIWITEPDQLVELAGRAATARIATQIHGIGDAAVRAALDAFEAPATRNLALRARVEHAQLVDPADLPRFGRLGVVASIQPVHLRADAAQARAGWGARAEDSAYAYRSLLAQGATLAFGTDAPVEPIDPWPGIALAITRRWPDWPAGSGRFGAGQALSLAQALRGACLGPAIAEGATDRGRLTVGQRADLLVIGGAGLAEPIEAEGPLATTRPRLVLVDGIAAYEA